MREESLIFFGVDWIHRNRLQATYLPHHVMFSSFFIEAMHEHTVYAFLHTYTIHMIPKIQNLGRCGPCFFFSVALKACSNNSSSRNKSNFVAVGFQPEEEKEIGPLPTLLSWIYI